MHKTTAKSPQQIWMPGVFGQEMQVSIAGLLEPARLFELVKLQ